MRMRLSDAMLGPAVLLAAGLGGALIRALTGKPWEAGALAAVCMAIVYAGALVVMQRRMGERGRK